MEQIHNRDCWCENCWEFKVEEYIDEWRQYASEVFKKVKEIWSIQRMNGQKRYAV